VATEAMEIDAAEGVSSGGHQPPQRVKVRQFIETEFDVTLRCLDEAAAGKEPVQVLPPESQLQVVRLPISQGFRRKT
jgi:hypothetical protein